MFYKDLFIFNRYLVFNGSCTFFVIDNSISDEDHGLCMSLQKSMGY